MSGCIGKNKWITHWKKTYSFHFWHFDTASVLSLKKPGSHFIHFLPVINIGGLVIKLISEKYMCTIWYKIIITIVHIKPVKFPKLFFSLSLSPLQNIYVSPVGSIPEPKAQSHAVWCRRVNPLRHLHTILLVAVQGDDTSAPEVIEKQTIMNGLKKQWRGISETQTTLNDGWFVRYHNWADTNAKKTHTTN